MPPEFKSRLCGRGDLEGIDGLRTDSPTAEIEAHHLLFSFAASNKLILKTADISNAYFQGELLDRVLLLKPPQSGIPDPEYEDGETMILARVPIYGTQDAGRKLWTKFRRAIQEQGQRENQIAKAVYVYEVDGDIKAVLLTHVDDMCWAAKEGWEEPITKILETFDVRKVEQQNFRFCGKEIVQRDNFDIGISCKHATETIGPVRYHSTDRKLTDEASPAEIAQMRSVIGSLGWIARQCRPDLSYLVSKLQGAVSKARLQDLKETNFAIEQVLLHSDVCLKFRHDAISWDNAMVATVTDT